MLLIVNLKFELVLYFKNSVMNNINYNNNRFTAIMQVTLLVGIPT